jgi:hypothetical protein
MLIGACGRFQKLGHGHGFTQIIFVRQKHNPEMVGAGQLKPRPPA